MANAIQFSVSKVRGLKIRRKLVVGVYGADELRAFVTRELTRGAGGKRLDLTGDALRLFGMAADDYRLRKGVLDLLQEQVAGLYDPRSRTLRLVKKLIHVVPANPVRVMLLGDPADETRVVMAHEIVHALQDQHYNLAKMARDRPHNADLETALAGLIEGDATAAMIAWMMVDKGTGDAAQLFASDGMMVTLFRFIMKFARIGLLPDTAALAKAPRWLQDRLTVPYVDGLALCLKAGRRRGFAGVDALFKRPPLSSEQILHPAKLLAKKRDNPWILQVRLPRKGIGDGWKLLWHDTFGELGARSLFASIMREDGALAAAAGWGGDRWLLFGKGSKRAVVWLSQWDTTRDADEAEAGLLRWAKAGTGRSVQRRKLMLLASARLPNAIQARAHKLIWQRLRSRRMTRLPR